MTKIYVAAHCRWAGLHVASVLRATGHEITSRWLDEHFAPTSEYTVEDRRRIAVMDTEDVQRSEALVLLAGPDRYPGGKFVEAGIAIGCGLRVVVIGRRENMLLWHPAVLAVDTPEQAAQLLWAGK